MPEITKSGSFPSTESRKLITGTAFPKHSQEQAWLVSIERALGVCRPLCARLSDCKAQQPYLDGLRRALVPFEAGLKEIVKLTGWGAPMLPDEYTSWKFDLSEGSSELLHYAKAISPGASKLLGFASNQVPQSVVSEFCDYLLYLGEGLRSPEDYTGTTSGGPGSALVPEAVIQNIFKNGLLRGSYLKRKLGAANLGSDFDERPRPEFAAPNVGIKVVEGWKDFGSYNHTSYIQRLAGTFGPYDPLGVALERMGEDPIHLHSQLSPSLVSERLGSTALVLCALPYDSLSDLSNDGTLFLGWDNGNRATARCSLIPPQYVKRVLVSKTALSFGDTPPERVSFVSDTEIVDGGEISESLCHNTIEIPDFRSALKGLLLNVVEELREDKFVLALHSARLR